MDLGADAATRLAWRRTFARAFDPYRDLTPEECAHLYVVRPRAPAARLVEALEEGDPEATRIALVGARGCGKSTELREVFRRLSQEAGGMVPLLVDIGQGLPPGAATAAWLPLVAAAARAAREDWGGQVTDGGRWTAALGRLGVRSELVDALLGAVRTVGPWLGPHGLAVAAAADQAAGLADVLGRVARAAHLAQPARGDLELLVDALRDELQALRQAAGRPAALLLDGLDKRGSADEVFGALADADLLYGLPAALVITGPIQLQTDGRFAAWMTPGRFVSAPMYNLPVVDRAGRSKPLGLDPLIELFERRWRDADLGPKRFPPEVVLEAARWSSGIVREFLHLIRETGREALRAGRPSVTAADLAQTVRERRHALESTLASSTWDLLEEVLAQQEAPGAAHGELLYQNAIVCYPNDSVWYRPNELLVPYLDARARRRAADEA